MTLTAATTLGASPLWLMTRSTGIVSFLLLTLSFGFGLAATKRALASRMWPRIATQELHRNVSLLALAFLVVHIVTSIADTFVSIGWWSAVVPFVSPYRTFWTALGTIATDLTIAMIATSLVRHRLPLKVWRGIHLAAYAVWPMSFFHFIKTGTDAAHGRWGLYLAAGSLTALLAATAVRWLTSDQSQGPIRSVSIRSAR